MMCENCGERESVYTVVTMSGTTKTHVHLCEKCAAERGVQGTETPAHPLGEFLQAVQGQMQIAPSELGRCTFCSSTLRDFRATGRLGCAQCYTSFETSLRELLRRVHGAARHTGRRYEPPQDQELGRGGLLGALREQLRQAITTEQFELAADLRDRIKVLE